MRDGYLLIVFLDAILPVLSQACPRRKGFATEIAFIVRAMKVVHLPKKKAPVSKRCIVIHCHVNYNSAILG